MKLGVLCGNCGTRLAVPVKKGDTFEVALTALTAHDKECGATDAIQKAQAEKSAALRAKK